MNAGTSDSLKIHCLLLRLLLINWAIAWRIYVGMNSEKKTNDRNGTNTRALPPAQRHSFRNLLFYLAEKCGSMISSRIRANSQNVRCQLMRIVELLNWKMEIYELQR